MIFRVLLMALLFPVAAPADSYPRVVEHALGETTIPSEPQRIVSVGYHEQDFLYALGLAPVGVHEWFGNQPYATWTWAEDARRAVGATPTVQHGYEIDVEWVHAQSPDLIIASYFNLDRATYDLMSRIAPVVAAPKGYPVWGAPWQEELRLIAYATDREQEAEAIILGIEQQISGIAEANPDFSAQTATMGYFTSDHFVGYRSSSGANALLGGLGLQAPAIFDELVQPNGQFSISPERLDLFELDAVVWLVDPATAQHIRDMPVYRNTRLAREARGIWLDIEMTGALSFMTPLSIPYALERLEPLLQDALDGNPSARTEAEHLTP